MSLLESKLDIGKIFNEELKDKNFYLLSFNDINNLKELFNRLFEIYKIGFITKFSNKENGIFIDLIYDNHILLINKYMKSMGIEVLFKKYELDELDKHYKKLVKIIKIIYPDLEYKYIIDDETKKIYNLEFTLKKCIPNYLYRFLIKMSLKDKINYLDLINHQFQNTNLIDYVQKIYYKKNLYTIRFSIDK